MGHNANLLLIFATLAAVGQLAAHYIPWEKLIGRRLPRLAAYTVGTGINTAAFIGWALFTGNVESIWALVAIVLASGTLVALVWWMDYTVDTRDKVEDIDEQVQLFERALRYYDGEKNERRRTKD